MNNVELMADGMIFIPRRIQTKDEALKIAAGILHAVGETDFSKLSELIDEIKKREEANKNLLANLALVRQHGFYFLHTQDVWYKDSPIGHIIVTRQMLESNDFADRLKVVEAEAVAPAGY